MRLDRKPGALALAIVLLSIGTPTLAQMDEGAPPSEGFEIGASAAGDSPALEDELRLVNGRIAHVDSLIGAAVDGDSLYIAPEDGEISVGGYLTPDWANETGYQVYQTDEIVADLRDRRIDLVERRNALMAALGHRGSAPDSGPPDGLPADPRDRFGDDDAAERFLDPSGTDDIDDARTDRRRARQQRMDAGRDERQQLRNARRSGRGVRDRGTRSGRDRGVGGSSGQDSGSADRRARRATNRAGDAAGRAARGRDRSSGNDSGRRRQHDNRRADRRGGSEPRQCANPDPVWGCPLDIGNDDPNR